MLRLFNTLTKKKEAFRPLNDKIVTMYNCGLTVYDYAHIGNIRAYTFADVLRRYLEYKGYSVKQVMNFTDVGHMLEDIDVGEDKMEVAAVREKKDPWAIAEFYIKEFLKDSKMMNFEEPMVRPRATEHIKEIIDLVQRLIDKGYAYIVNGSVYYDVSKFKKYGELSGNTMEKLEAGAGGRVENNPDKKDQLDFALWICDPRHIMNWKSPWCEKGYPGWHIECSTMSMKYLGETVDIHTGGEDNIFPHHECEIAQSEGATSKKFVRYWLHLRHLMVNGEKMSKSKKNYYTLRDLLDRGYSPKAIRYLMLSAQYRTSMNFTEESLENAEETVSGLLDFMDKIRELKAGADYSETLHRKVAEAKERFEKDMDDDLNVPQALASIFELVRETNKAIDEKKASEKNLHEVYEQIMEFDRVLGVLEKEKAKEELAPELKKLIMEREKDRKSGDFGSADKIRKELAEKGIILEDNPEGPRWRRAR
ncbi:MAG: cysteine--tRNA ligase [Candidatus Micrarchaeales archaeon]